MQRKTPRISLSKRHKNKKRPHITGAPPGSLSDFGPDSVVGGVVSATVYTPDELEETLLEQNRAVTDLQKPKKGILWIHITGLPGKRFLSSLGELFGIHPLTLEDIQSTEHPPKEDFFETYQFVVLKSLISPVGDEPLRTGHVCIIFRKGLVISIEETAGSWSVPVKKRLASKNGKIRYQGADYLAYALMDAVVDEYFTVLEVLETKVDQLESEAGLEGGPSLRQQLLETRKEMIFFRKSILPVREIFLQLIREESGHIREATRPFLRDVADHTDQLMASAEMLREIITGLIDFELSMASHRMNETMRVLTVISTIFIPLSFIAGVYGMNFDHMPELRWKWGYFAIWLVMLAIFFIMLYYFRKKKWL